MDIDTTTLARARLALHAAMRNFLFVDPNLNLIDFGYKMKSGQLREGEPTIRFHVRQKFSQFALEAAINDGYTREEYPKAIGEFQTDVIEASYRTHRWGSWWQTTANGRAARAEILRGGISISNEYQYGYGTLGGLVFDRATGDEMILSNWHVLAGSWSARRGQLIYQPGRLDGGTSRDAIASLARHAMSDNLDAAVAAVHGNRRTRNEQFELGSVTGVGQAQYGMEVVKSGRKTGVTSGRVTAIEGIAKISYAHVPRIIFNVITIDRYITDEVSAPGDSGSWWLDATTRQAVGLHFAGSNSPERALAIDMQTVLDALDVDIVTG
ncbi:MAG: S1 family peptidase [candidate division KSB1 bacterium]|nr:S1 family peptidase [candidate division KSB1 bacterium]MDZ7301292.1 S1 family peptidase [candidate division KSB1 bacterium]MDZ7310823.1 S1 family peptidase [candidate division KSB1 bacterium]